MALDELAAIEREKRSPAGRQLKAKLADRDWRLDNLYRIRNENGDEIKFVRNDAQRAYDLRSWSRDVIPKARKLGFSTYIGIQILDQCLTRAGTTAGIVDRSIDDATEKLGIIKFAYQTMPGLLGQQLRASRKLVKDNEKELVFANGSSVSVGTTYRGGTPALLHISEYGKVSIDSPDTAREIKTGAIQAVPATGKVWVESTAHGTSGEFYELVKRSRALQEQKAPLTALDFRLHFFGWWMKREYRLPNNLVTLTQEQRQYFEEVLHKHGITLDADQKAWYAKKADELGPDDIKQEFPTFLDELFFNSVLGAYWKVEINRARRDHRIGLPVPYDPTRPVNTAWDIGEDMTAIVFHQSDGVRHRIIDYWEEEGSSLQAACGVIHDKRQQRGFVYGAHYGPHDLDHRDWAHESQSRKTTAAGLGVNFTVVPRVEEKADSIEAGRRLLNMCWIDQEHAALLVERCENYRKRWNKTVGMFVAEPVHDINCHGADALQQLAMGFTPLEPKRGRGGRERPRGSAWSN